MAQSSYIDTIDTIYPDGYTRERPFVSAGDMVAPVPQEGLSIWTRMVQACAHWRARRAGRLALQELSAERLDDIGLTRADVERGVPEADRERWEAIVALVRTEAATPIKAQDKGTTRRAG